MIIFSKQNLLYESEIYKLRKPVLHIFHVIHFDLWLINTILYIKSNAHGYHSMCSILASVTNWFHRSLVKLVNWLTLVFWHPFTFVVYISFVRLQSHLNRTTHRANDNQKRKILPQSQAGFIDKAESMLQPDSRGARFYRFSKISSFYSLTNDSNDGHLI